MEGIYKASMAKAPTAPRRPEPIRAVGMAAPAEEVELAAAPLEAAALADLLAADTLDEAEERMAVTDTISLDRISSGGFKLVEMRAIAYRRCCS
jgi:hypothetical protein